MRAIAVLSVATTLVLCAPAAPVQAESSPTGHEFRSVLAFGQGQSVPASEYIHSQASGSPPASFVSQFDMYTGILRAGSTLTTASLDRYYKDSGFGTVRGADLPPERPRPGVTIVRDATHRVPRVQGDTRADVMYGAGYVTAQDRLFQMDLARRTARATTVGLLGPAAAEADSRTLWYQDFSEEELNRQFEALPAISGPDGAQARLDLLDYIEGINDFIDAVKADPTRLPAEYVGLGTVPEPWTKADTTALVAWMMGEVTVSGGREPRQAEVLQALRRRFGETSGRRVFADFRRREDPESPTITSKPFRSDRTGRVNPRAVAIPDLGSQRMRNAIVGESPTIEERSRLAWADRLAKDPFPIPRHMSNAVVVSGRHTRSGRPLASMGPQAGYFSPALFMELELHGGGIDVSGVVFPGTSPFPLIGHGRDFVWSGTSAQGDNADVFVERLCEPEGGRPTYESRHYLYKGKCRPFISREQTTRTPVSPLDPQPPQEVSLRTLRSVHGPIYRYATVKGEPVALSYAQATDWHALQSTVAFMRLAENRVTDAEGFAKTMLEFTGGENWFYADADEVGWIQSGWYPRRSAGTDPELPTWGTGDFDWLDFEPEVNGYRRLPARSNPLAIEPKKGFLVDWNSKSAPGWRNPPGMWSGSVQRKQLLERPLQEELDAGRLDLAGLARVSTQAASADLRGAEVLPWLERVIGETTGGETAGAETRKHLDLLGAWQRRGSLRRDADGDGVYEDSAAVLLMDAWWPRLVRAIFLPALGDKALETIDRQVNPIDAPAYENFFYRGWETYVQKDLRTILGRNVRGKLSREYCGAGSRRRCASLLTESLHQAASELRSELGPDPARWRMLATCPGDERPRHCDQIEPIALGAISTPAIPFHNRGTFHQLVAMSR